MTISKKVKIAEVVIQSDKNGKDLYYYHAGYRNGYSLIRTSKKQFDEWMTNDQILHITDNRQANSEELEIIIDTTIVVSNKIDIPQPSNVVEFPSQINSNSSEELSLDEVQEWADKEYSKGGLHEEEYVFRVKYPDNYDDLHEYGLLPDGTALPEGRTFADYQPIEVEFINPEQEFKAVKNNHKSSPINPETKIVIVPPQSETYKIIDGTAQLTPVDPEICIYESQPLNREFLTVKTDQQDDLKTRYKQWVMAMVEQGKSEKIISFEDWKAIADFILV